MALYGGSHWRTIKATVRARSGGICERCHVNKATHAHHVTYERNGRELPEDVLDLCLGCHNEQHPHHNFATPPPSRKPKRKLSDTPGITKRERELLKLGLGNYVRKQLRQRHLIP